MEISAVENLQVIYKEAFPFKKQGYPRGKHNNKVNFSDHS